MKQKQKRVSVCVFVPERGREGEREGGREGGREGKKK